MLRVFVPAMLILHHITSHIPSRLYSMVMRSSLCAATRTPPSRVSRSRCSTSYASNLVGTGVSLVRKVLLQIMISGFSEPFSAPRQSRFFVMLRQLIFMTLTVYFAAHYFSDFSAVGVDECCGVSKEVFDPTVESRLVFSSRRTSRLCAKKC